MITEHIKSKEFAVKIMEILDKDYKPPRKPPGVSTRKPRYWFNNGSINKYRIECPKGFVAGMIKRKSDAKSKNM